MVAEAISGGSEQAYSAGVDILAAEFVGEGGRIFGYGLSCGGRCCAVGAIFPARAAALGECADWGIPVARGGAERGQDGPVQSKLRGNRGARSGAFMRERAGG